MFVDVYGELETTVKEFAVPHFEKCVFIYLNSFFAIVPILYFVVDIFHRSPTI